MFFKSSDVVCRMALPSATDLAFEPAMVFSLVRSNTVKLVLSTTEKPLL